MRGLALCLLLVASPAFAETAVEQVHEMVIAQNTEAGFSPAIAEGPATCFTAGISEDEAAVILGSEPGPAQQVAARMMQHDDDAVACPASVVQ